MKIKLAKTSGFCMGVRKAVEQALDAVHTRPGPIWSYGPLIHNPQALDLLAGKGLRVMGEIPDESEARAMKKGTVIIRAHGVPPGEKERLVNLGLEVIDATCPRVKGVQARIRKHTGMGASAIIWGNPDHPEVVGLMGHARGRGYVVTKPEDVAALPDLDKVILVAQTTQNQQKFVEISDAVRARWPEAEVFDTICGATQKRQDEVRRLSKLVDAMVVVGGHASGNTERLANVARNEGVKTVHIETEDELDPAWVADSQTVGVTAGASTPNWMIKRVIRKLDRLARRRDHSFRGVSRRILRALILSNTYVAFGSGALCLAMAIVRGYDPQPAFFGVSFFYIHAMHMLNLFLDKESSEFNDPDRVMFLEKHKAVLLSSGLFSALVSLFLAFTLSIKVFALLAVMSTLGLLYAIPLVPKNLPRQMKIRRLKDIPASKTMSVSCGWAVLLSLIPVLSPGGRLGWDSVMAAAAVFLFVFIRSALGDVMEIQGDRIVGRETIPILIGEKKTYLLLRIATALVVLVLILGFLLKVFSGLALMLIACAAYAAFYQYLFRRDQVLSSVFFEALIDANFILAGVLACLWNLASGG
jgi:(E)-4-hydroxy-3-methyl-but-2-enyl pyrophosphate reductase